RLDARDRIPTDAVGITPSDGEVDPHLAAGLAGQVHVRDAADLHAGEPDRRALHEPGDLGELGVNRVVRLEEPRPGAEGVHHAEEGREGHEDEHAYAELHRDLASLVIHRLASPAARATPCGSHDHILDSPRTAGVRSQTRLAFGGGSYGGPATPCGLVRPHPRLASDGGGSITGSPRLR